MSQKTHTNFLAAFEPNQVYESLTEGRITSDVFQAGDLVLPSGRIIACDPGWLWCKDVDPFSRTVPPGRYPVLLSVVDSGRTACAMVKFCSESPVRWEMALRPGEDLAELRGNQFFGYGVDAGMGCFVDAQVVERRSDEELQGLVDRAIAQSWQLHNWLAAQDLVTQLTYPSQQIVDRSGFNLTLDPDNLPTFNLTLDPDTGGNAIAFGSGYGDGSYASYWGFTADDELACLVTDFKVLLEYITPNIEIEVTRFLEKSIEHPDLEQLEMAIRLSVHRPSWVQLSDDSLNDQPSNPDCILVLEGQGPQPSSVHLEPGGFSGCRMILVSEWIEEDRWYREYWFKEPLQANALLKMTLNSEVYPLQPVTTNA